MSRWIVPVTLEGEHVVLEPLQLAHLDGIQDAARDGELWRLWYTHVPSPEDAREYVETALAMQSNEGALPFAVRERASGEIVGSTRYFNVDQANHRLEIVD